VTGERLTVVSHTALCSGRASPRVLRRAAASCTAARPICPEERRALIAELLDISSVAFGRDMTPFWARREAALLSGG